MNKTVSINLGGWFFHIEEEAYQNLDAYLGSIQRYFANDEGGQEIVEDIESRIAEMFQESLGKSKRQVIVAGDVHTVVKIMGNPEQFDQINEGETITGNSTNTQNSSTVTLQKQSETNNNTGQGQANSAQDDRNTNRRLYRNTDEKVIGGVCSGLSAYFGINDPIWIRLAFALSFFIFGYGILIYLLMMVIVPPAKTSAQKLAMKGEPVNIENIEKTFREGISSFQSRIEEFQNSESGRRTGDFFSKTIERFHEIAPAVGNSGLTILKWLGLLVGSVLVFSLVVSLIGALVGMLASLKFLMQFVFVSPLTAIALVICSVLLIGIPIVAISYLILKRMFRLRPDNNAKWLTGLASFWSISLAAFSILGFTTYQSDFSYKENDQQIITLTQPTGNTLYLEASNENKPNDKDSDNDIQFNKSFFDTEKGQFYVNGVRLDIEKSNSGQFELVKKIRTRAGNEENAKQLLKQIDYQFSQTDSVIHLNTFFDVNNSKWRGQDISLTLNVPVGKSVFFTPSSEDIIYDVENITNTYDGDMIGLSWTMTERGLMLSPNQAGAAAKINNAQNNTQNSQSPDKETLLRSFVKSAHEIKAGEIQKTYDDLGEFEELAIAGNFDVRIVQGPSYKVILTGSNEAINDAGIDVNSNTLSAAWGGQKILGGSNSGQTLLGLYIEMPTLDNLAISGNCMAQISGFAQENTTLALSGSTAVQAQLEVKDIETALSGSAVLTLVGKGNRLSTELSGSSALMGLHFEAEELEAELDGASMVEISVSQRLNAEVNNASLLRYSGNPETVELNKNDSGKIETIE